MFAAPFHHRILRKMVTLFGTLFNNLWVVRETHDGVKKEQIKVGLTYAPKEKYITRLLADPTLTKSIMISLPRMSFEMLGLSYDPSRKQQSLIRNTTGNSSSGSLRAQYMGTPYNFEFSLSIYTRNIEDGAMIVEQILPYFQPDYTISAVLVEEMNIVKDIPVILTGIQENIEYEGDIEASPRIVTWDLTFTMKGWIFGPVSNSAIIMGVAGSGNTVTGGVHINIYQDGPTGTLQTVKTTGGNGNFIDGETIIVTARHAFGKVAGWSNTSNTLQITQSSGKFMVNDQIVGLDSNETRTILTVGSSDLKLVDMIITQDPLSANANSDYSYTTSITEFPDTL